MIDSHEIAWAAGFFDGEGCTTLSHRYMYMQVKQVDEHGIRRFHHAVGGLGNVRGPVASAKETRAPIYIWRVGGKDAITAMATLWPYLGPAKREQYERRFAEWDKTRHGGTHCRRDHEFTPENTIITKQGERACRTCRRDGERIRYHRRKLAAA